MTKVLLVGGTSGGHLAPMVAVAEALEKLEPSIALSFVCSDKPSDKEFLALEKRACTALPLPRPNLSLPFTFVKAFAVSLRVLKKEKPDVVFSKGSAVSVPMCLAARMNGIPVVLHESDGVMGRANKMVSHIAIHTLSGPVIGNPIRARITQGSKEEGLRMTGLSGTKPVLLVMGGSQGARSINEAVARHLDTLLHTVDVIHLTGTGKTVAKSNPGYYATEFGSDVLPHLYAAADIAVSRAGGGSIAELAACSVPMILVPIRGLAGDHQVKNAERAEQTGAAIVLAQEKLDELPALIASLLADSVRIQTLRDRCRYAAKPEAARLIAETVLASVARKKIDA